MTKVTWILLVFCLCGLFIRNVSASTNELPFLAASFSEPIVSPNITNGNGTAPPSVPLFYGWFFNESTAESISIIGKKYFLSAYDKIPKFQLYINELMARMNVTNPLEFYVKPLDPDSGLPDMKYHTTAKFCGRNLTDLSDECSQYLEQVGQYLGRPYRIHFVGLFFTNNTYGIRVKLTAEEQKLFREDTRVNTAQQSESEPNNEIERLGREEGHFAYEPYYYYGQPSRSLETMGSSGSPFYPGIKFQSQKKNFHPTESRAHVTLGCAPGILAVQTGLDLLNIIDLEVSSFAEHEDFDVGGTEIPKAVLREIKVDSGTGSFEAAAFVLYPEDEMIADAIFDAYL